MKRSDLQKGGTERKGLLIDHSAALLFADFDEEYRDDAVRAACLACERYGMNWSCPPFEDGATAGLRNTYGSIEVVCCQALLSDRPGRSSDRAGAERLKRETFHRARSSMVRSLLTAERDRPGTRALFPGSCELCDGDCTRAQGLACVQPSLMRPSLEALGYDLVKLVKDLFELEFHWAAEGEIPPYQLLVGALLTPREDARREALTARAGGREHQCGAFTAPSRTSP